MPDDSAQGLGMISIKIVDNGCGLSGDQREDSEQEFEEHGGSLALSSRTGARIVAEIRLPACDHKGRNSFIS